ncbi:MAG: hypothetical protein R2865_05385 [Deinococcales bacterium]
MIDILIVIVLAMYACQYTGKLDNAGKKTCDRAFYVGFGIVEPLSWTGSQATLKALLGLKMSDAMTTEYPNLTSK